MFIHMCQTVAWQSQLCLYVLSFNMVLGFSTLPCQVVLLAITYHDKTSQMVMSYADVISETKSLGCEVV